jgi:predicted peroxiredoxin
MTTTLKKEKNFMAKFLISLTSAKDNTDKATVAFVVANASIASGVETVVFLSTEGVRLSQQGYASDIHEEGFKPLQQLMDDYIAAGGKIWVCSPCFKKRSLDENNLVNSAVIVGGAKVVEFLTTGGTSIAY